MAAETSPPAGGRRPGLRRRVLWITACGTVVWVVASLLAGIALAGAYQNRNHLLDRLDPARQDASLLLTALVDEETGVRGFALAEQASFLTPYTTGRTQERAARAALGRAVAPFPDLAADLAVIDREAATWHSTIAAPEIARARSGGPRPSAALLNAGRRQFDAIRAAFATFNNHLSSERSAAVSAFNRALLLLVVLIAAALIGVAGLFIGTALTLRRMVLRPLASLGEDSRRVATGDLTHPVDPTGPTEIAELARDIEAMRSRIVAELAAIEAAQEDLQQRNEELSRSNRDLEQFAYVASHDLQEPLRKVASFCQLLEARYRDKLDDRGVQYIDFAVDGAKRMQALVNDLLAFSRVGRTTERFTRVDCGDALTQARSNLAARIDETGASIEAGELPVVDGDPGLLVALFQNLLSNSIKFRSDSPPVIRIDARPAEEEDRPVWLFSVADNGIGIEDKFAERVFVIFQRLHPRDRYEGTGIGLALCRKIVEFHGGRIWIEPSTGAGTTISFVLPVPAAEPAAEPAPDGSETGVPPEASSPSPAVTPATDAGAPL